MSKKVKVICRIKPDGKITMETKGTVGNQCVKLLEFSESLQGMTKEKEGKTPDYDVAPPLESFAEDYVSI